MAGWYLIDFARSRHANPSRIPVSVNADRYYKLIAPTEDEYIFVPRGALWAEPDRAMAADPMRAVVADPVRARLKASTAAQFIAENFSVDAVAQRYGARLRDIRRNVRYNTSAPSPSVLEGLALGHSAATSYS